MYRSVVGIDNAEGNVGYKKIQIKPYVVDSLTHANASFETYYGKVSNAWKIENNRIVMESSIPVNTTAIIYFPSKQNILLNGKKDPLESGMRFLRSENGYMVYEAGSGNYRFEGDR